MRNLIYTCTKGNATIETASYSEMRNLVEQGYTSEIHLEEIYEEWIPTKEREKVIIR